VARAGLIVRILTAALLLTVIFFSFIYDPKWFEPSPPPAKVTEYQKRFCEALEDARAKYYQLLGQWSAADKEKNGIVQQRVSNEMDNIIRQRNQRIFALAQQRSFVVDGWQVAIVEIDRPFQGWVDVKARLTCSRTTLLHVRVGGDGISLLAAKKQNDRLFVTGRFTEKYGRDTPQSAEKFEGSLTDSGSMQEPEFWLVAKTLDQ
jgi:hypothetical protein